ncbi:Protein T2 [Balamuthia mandrillaris]
MEEAVEGGKFTLRKVRRGTAAAERRKSTGCEDWEQHFWRRNRCRNCGKHKSSHNKAAEDSTLPHSASAEALLSPRYSTTDLNNRTGAVSNDGLNAFSSSATAEAATVHRKLPCNRFEETSHWLQRQNTLYLTTSTQGSRASTSAIASSSRSASNVTATRSSSSSVKTRPSSSSSSIPSSEARTTTTNTGSRRLGKKASVVAEENPTKQQESSSSSSGETLRTDQAVAGSARKKSKKEEKRRNKKKKKNGSGKYSGTFASIRASELESPKATKKASSLRQLRQKRSNTMSSEMKTELKQVLPLARMKSESTFQHRILPQSSRRPNDTDAESEEGMEDECFSGSSSIRVPKRYASVAKENSELKAQNAQLKRAMELLQAKCDQLLLEKDSIVKELEQWKSQAKALIESKKEPPLPSTKHADVAQLQNEEAREKQQADKEKEQPQKENDTIPPPPAPAPTSALSVSIKDQTPFNKHLARASKRFSSAQYRHSQRMSRPLDLRAEHEKENRNNVAKELLTTERNYVNCLNLIMQQFQQPLQKAADAEKEADRFITKTEVKSLFSQVEIIRAYNAQLLARLERRMDDWSDESIIGDIFIEMSAFLKVYGAYVANYESAMQTLSSLKQKSKKFREFLEAENQKNNKCKQYLGWEIESFLITPVQRIPRYITLLKQLFKYTPEGHPDYNLLKEAINKIETVANINESNHAHTINAAKLSYFQNKLTDQTAIQLVEPHRRYVCDARACIHQLIKSNSKAGKAKARLVRALLFSDIIMFASMPSVVIESLHSKAEKEEGQSLHLREWDEALLLLGLDAQTEEKELKYKFHLSIMECDLVEETQEAMKGKDKEHAAKSTPSSSEHNGSLLLTHNNTTGTEDVWRLHFGSVTENTRWLSAFNASKAAKKQQVKSFSSAHLLVT